MHEAEGNGGHEIHGAGGVTLTGYLETDDELTDHIAACDVTLNLRWPTARETSGPWLRALAAGKATVITDLAHLTDVVSLDPRTWRVQEGGGRRSEVGGRQIVDPGSTDLRSPTSDLRSPTSDPRPPTSVAIDILDEDHSLRLAMRRLAADADLRARLGRAAREYWTREHSVEGMADDYERLIERASASGPPSLASRASAEQPAPRHLAPAGDEKLRGLLQPFGLRPPI